MTTNTNPHINEMIAIEKKFDLERDHEGIRSANRKGTMTHPGCGGTAWFKPTVGRFVCECSAVFAKGEWR